ncbi:MAG: hypothetical protein AAGB22_09475 [Bacteroidota bacterium]
MALPAALQGTPLRVVPPDKPHPLGACGLVNGDHLSFFVEARAHGGSDTVLLQSASDAYHTLCVHLELEDDIPSYALVLYSGATEPLLRTDRLQKIRSKRLSAEHALIETHNASGLFRYMSEPGIWLPEQLMIDYHQVQFTYFYIS